MELSFYFVAPLLFLLWNKSPVKALLLLVFVLAAATACGQVWHYFNGNKDQYFYPFDFVLHSTFFGRFPEFIAGVWLAGIIHQQHPDPFSRIRKKTITGFAGIFISLFAISFLQRDIFHHGNDTVIGAILQYTLIPLFAVIWMYGLMKENTL